MILAFFHYLLTFISQISGHPSLRSIQVIIYHNFFQAEQQNKAAIGSAEGDAIGADLLSQAFKKAGNSLIELRKIEAGEEIAQNMAGNKNVVYLPEGQGVLMNMPSH